MSQDHNPLYGKDSQEPLARLKSRSVRERFLQAAGLMAMASILLVAAILSGVPAIVVAALVPLLFSLFPLAEVRTIQRLRAVEIFDDGIRLPTPLVRIGRSDFLSRDRIERLDLHESPYRPYIEFFLVNGSSSKSIILEKEFIFDWTGFLEALSKMGLVGIAKETPLPEGVAAVRNTHAVRKLQRVFSTFVVLTLVVIAILIFSGVRGILSILGGLLAILTMFAVLSYEARSVPLRFAVDGGNLRVRTTFGQRLFRLHESDMYIGRERLLIRGRDGRIWEFRHIDPDVIRYLASLPRVRAAG